MPRKPAKKTTIRKTKRNFRLFRRGSAGRHLWAFTKWGAVLGIVVFIWFVYDLPDITNVEPLETKPSITLLASDGSTIMRLGGIKGETVKLKDLPPHVANAVIAIEDRRFYSHIGIDPVGLARAMWVNVREGGWVQGGSTITQQLAKNLFLTPDKTLRRKVQEALMALWIDARFSKEQIITAYLNRVYYGSGAYGIDAAAKVYYGKPAHDLTLWESAVMAGLLKAPSRYSPATNPKLAKERAKLVIAAMNEAGFIDAKTEKRELKNGNIKLANNAMGGDLNRYFADWIIDQIDSFITVGERDITVQTTLDPRFQLTAEKRMDEMFKTIPAQDKVSQGAIVTLAKDGAVLAMIGGRDYTESQFNRATQAQRQPGSSFKPFVYLAALETGFSPNDMVLDAPVRIGSYAPENYDGSYYGDVTLTDALAMSLNAATIRLLSQVGVDKLIDVTTRMGFTMPFKPELATGLGASETNLLELTNAYAVISNGGFSVLPYAVVSIEDSKGKKLYEHEYKGYSRMFSGYDTRNLDGMLVQVIARGTGQSAQLSRGHTAGKTGTTQNYRDAWFIGYTDNAVTGVWMGNDDNQPMRKVTGGKYPARLWHNYMQDVIDIEPSTGKIYGDDNTDDRRNGLSDIGSSSSGDFSQMLQKWSTGDGRFTGNNKPVYNP